MHIAEKMEYGLIFTKMDKNRQKACMTMPIKLEHGKLGTKKEKRHCNDTY